MVGYGPDPNGCVRLIQSLGAVAVSGNHDLGAIGSIDLWAFNNDAREACEWTGRVLEGSARTYLETLESIGADDELLLVHGSPRDPIWEYVLSSHQAYENFLEFEQKLCFHGHSHVPAVFRWSVESQRDDDLRAIELTVPVDGDKIDIEEGYRFMINVGSVGQPRDGDPRSCYVIYDISRDKIEYHRVAYEVERVQESMEEAGLPVFLINRLAYGR
jgi:diadenosine tetraphosphatase ApaH/serine/threonine PP2A family protein phosphatase